MERLLNMVEVAEMLGVEESTVYSWTHRKTIPHIKIGRLLRFRESDIAAWLEDKAVNQWPAKTVLKPKGGEASRVRSNNYVDRIVENAKKEVLKT
jgi:excisionase family DNA binding protein